MKRAETGGLQQELLGSCCDYLGNKLSPTQQGRGSGHGAE